jgi:hypothetical protein
MREKRVLPASLAEDFGTPGERHVTLDEATELEAASGKTRGAAPWSLCAARSLVMHG